MSPDQRPVVDDVVECLGVLCPLPIIRLAERLRDAPKGALVMVTADDPAAANDVPALCEMRGHEFVGAWPLGDATGPGAPYGYVVRRGS